METATSHIDMGSGDVRSLVGKQPDDSMCHFGRMAVALHWNCRFDGRAALAVPHVLNHVGVGHTRANRIDAHSLGSHLLGKPYRAIIWGGSYDLLRLARTLPTGGRHSLRWRTVQS